VPWSRVVKNGGPIGWAGSGSGGQRFQGGKECTGRSLRAVWVSLCEVAKRPGEGHRRLAEPLPVLAGRLWGPLSVFGRRMQQAAALQWSDGRGTRRPDDHEGLRFVRATVEGDEEMGGGEPRAETDGIGMVSRGSYMRRC
jgi:hypothetical protein